MLAERFRRLRRGCYHPGPAAPPPAWPFEPMEEAYPTEVRRLPEERRLRLTWSDGHLAEYDYDYLRGYCPCAGCQGHGTGEVEFRRPAFPVEPSAIQPVGNYAISFQWSDGHATGIYRFDFLRRICPCDACRAARGEEAEPPTTEGGETNR